jgi:YD repeat-containing protein/VCBS repeat-containing protein
MFKQQTSSRRRKAKSPLADHPFFKNFRRAMFRGLSELAGSLFLKRGRNPSRRKRVAMPTRPTLQQLLGFQQLEAREMLYGYIQAHGEGPFEALNTQALTGTVSVSGSNPPFTAHLVTQAAHGTATVNADGDWSYTANTGFTGSDSFQYDATDAQHNTSNTATVSLDVTFGSLSDVDQTKVSADTLSLPMQILGTSSGQPATAANLSLVYNSSTASPVQTLEQDLQASMDPAASGTLEMTTAINGVQSSPTYTTTSNLSVNNPTIRLSMPDSTSSLASGRYTDSQTVTNVTNMSQPITVSTLTGAVNVVNDESSAFGAGWDMPGLYHIFQNSASGVPAGVLLTTGDGNGWYFTQGSGNSYSSPNGPEAFSTLVSLTGGGWQLTNQFGTVYTFNSSGFLTSTELRTTETTTYGWTGSDLTSITDSFGRSVALAYTNGLLSSITNFASSVWSFAYTGSTLTSITEPNPGSGSPVWNFGYTGNLLTTSKDPDSNQTSYSFSGNTLAADTLPGGAGESYTSEQSYGGGQPGGFNPANAVLSSTVQNSKKDANGNTSYFTTDLLGNVTTYTDPYGSVTTYTRDANGLVTQLTEPPPATGDAAPVTTYTHDSLGNETSASGAHPSYGTYVFNSFSEPTSFTDSLNNKWAWSYDTHGNLTSATDPLNNTVSYTVDSLGYTTSMTEPAPNDGTGTVTTNYTRDSDERLTKITFPDNSTQTFAYNTIDLQTSATDEDQNTTQTAFDVLGRVTSVTNAAGGVSTTTYDAANNILSTSDFLGNVTDFEYNSRNELVQETLPAQATGDANPVLAWTYDSNGNVLTYTNALSEVTTETWDKLNRMTSETLPPPAQGQSGPETTFAYDNDSHKISETNALSRTTSYAYANTDISQLTSVTLPPPSGSGQGPTTNYFYDADGRQNQVENALSQYTTTTFTADGQVASVKDNLNNATTYLYGHGGELLSTTDPLNHTSSDEYDSRYRLIQTTDANSGVTSITLDGAGNETKLVDSDNNSTSWTYNSLNLPLTETNALGTTTTGYNKAGLVTSIEDADLRVRDFTFNNDQQLTAENWMSGSTVVATMAYGYDLAGELTSASDPNSAYAFTYDGDGDVTSTDNNGTPNVPHVVLNATYDALGDMLTQSATIAGTADFLNNYSYDGDQQLTTVQQEQQSGGNTVANKEIDYGYNAIGQFTAIGY